MKNVTSDDIVIKESDYRKLMALIENSDAKQLAKLEEELSRAEIVPDDQYPEDVVGIGSKVGFVDLDTGRENEVVVVFPSEANIQEMRISVLTPMGSALIGLRAGGTIDWELPGRRKAKIKVLTVTQA